MYNRLLFCLTAVGGATVNDELIQGFTGPLSNIPSPSVFDQIATFLKLPRGGSNDLSQSLVIIYGGANDAFFGLPNITAAQVVAEVQVAVQRLKSRGATHFLLPTLPPLGGNYPFSTLVPSYSRPLAKYSAEHRAALFALAEADPSIVVADLFPLFRSIYENPTFYGFDQTVLDRSCLRGGELSTF
jgi:phospholipase/lecithinase/hemolysin